MTISYENWEVVIGLEIHVQLNTKSKMFGTEPYHFGSEPNIDIGVVCTGQPGSLPVVNKEAVEKSRPVRLRRQCQRRALQQI